MRNGFIAGGCLLWIGLAALTQAQSSSRAQVDYAGTTVTAAKFVTVYQADDRTTSTLTGGVTVDAADYSLRAQDATIVTRPTTQPGQSPIAKLTATGNAALGTQVTGHFDQRAAGRLLRTYTLRADQAVYTPDDSRPNGGVIDLTGHPVVTVHDPQALASDAVTTADQITILLGQSEPGGPDYPQISGVNGRTTLTPRPQAHHG